MPRTPADSDGELLVELFDELLDELDDPKRAALEDLQDEVRILLDMLMADYGKRWMLLPLQLQIERIEERLRRPIPGLSLVRAADPPTTMS
jgi:hypothetical protein